MHTLALIRRSLALAGLALAVGTVQATPVQLQYSGTVSNYLYGDLSGFVPLGTAMSMTINFNETFSDGSYDFSDNLGPVNGVLQMGAMTWTFDDYDAYAYGYNGFGGALSWVEPKFLGSGPAPTGANLFGLFVQMSTSLTVMNEVQLGFAFPRGSVTSFRYIEFTGAGQAVPLGQVPVPPTAALVAAAALALLLSQRRGRNI